MNHMASGFRAGQTKLVWLLAVVATAWLLVSTLSVLPGFAGGRAAALDTVSGLFPPLVILLLLATFLLIGRRPLEIDDVETRVDNAVRSVAELQERLGQIDAMLGACSDKVQRMSLAAAAEGTGLAATAQALEVAAGTMALSSADMGRAATALQDMMPGLTAQARDAEALLRTAGGQATLQIQAVDGTLAAVAARSTDVRNQAEASIAAMQKLLTQIDSTSGETTRAIANRAYTLDAAVTGVMERSTAAFSSIGETLQDYTRRIESMLAGARQDLDAFGSEGTRAIGQRLDVLLGAASQLKLQIADQQLLSDQLQQRSLANFADIEERLGLLRSGQEATASEVQTSVAASMAAIEAQLGELASRQVAAAILLQEQAATHVDAMDARLADLQARQRAAAERIEEQLAANIASIETRLGQLRKGQQSVADELQQQVAQSIATTEARLAELRLGQTRITAQLQEQLADGIATIEARLDDLRALGDAKLGETSKRIARTIAEIDGVGAALAAGQDATAVLEAQVSRLLPMLEDFTSAVDDRLPEVGASFEGAADHGRTMIAQLDELRDRIESQVAVLRDSAAAFERDHEAVVGLAETLAGHFGQARGIVGEIQASTEQTAIAAAARMVDNVVQVRQSVNATASEIRGLLAEVVSEAEQSLDNFASTKAEAAFGAPIRLQIASLEHAAVRAAEAANGASERVSARLIELMRTISETEARIDEVDTRMDVRARDTLAARSIRLLESLNNGSVNVARLLEIDAGDDAWDRYLKGDRSLFARTAVRLADKETMRKIARHFEHDEPFREEAARYLDQFETLIRRVLKDPDGEALGLVLLSSDIGKLYVLISQALGRPIARREG
ncbi:MAG: hypothetical protein KGZ61_13185 [Sandarakinorhabdus sp.]|nr:hypothetical protein [Sandarakinorhabdus sp.]